MKTFEESTKSQKTMKSMVENKYTEEAKKQAKGKENKPVKSELFWFILLLLSILFLNSSNIYQYIIFHISKLLYL